MLRLDAQKNSKVSSSRSILKDTDFVCVKKYEGGGSPLHPLNGMGIEITDGDSSFDDGG
jgi:hypothetical protein